RAGASFTVAFSMRNEGSRPGAAPELRWEMYSADGSWTLLGRSTPDGAIRPSGAEQQSSAFSDRTGALTRPGTVTFRRPDNAAPFPIPGGDRGAFLRVRLSAGVPHRIYVTDVRIAFQDEA